MSRYQTLEDLAAKIDWEGGIAEAVAYGIKHTDIPDGHPDLAAAWARLEDVHAEMECLCDEIHPMIYAE